VLRLKKKTSIYIEDELWERFKVRASAKGVEASSLLEELIKEELADQVSKALEELAGPEDYQLDFDPVKPREPVSPLIREMRDERADSLP